MPKPFGEWLDEEIERRGTNQRQLAIKINKSAAHVSKIVAGKAGVSPEMLRLLSDALGVSRAEIFRAWGESESGEDMGGSQETEYIVFTEDLTPEGYDDFDGTPQERQVAKRAATEAAKNTYMTVAQALRAARRESPGTVPGSVPRDDE